MRYNHQSIPDQSRPGLPTTAPVPHSRAPVEIMLLLNIIKTRGEREEEGECRDIRKCKKGDAHS